MDLRKRLEHTMLKPEADRETVLRYCEEAKEHGFRMVMVNGCYLPTVVEALKGTEVLAGVVVGFPLGQMTSEAKAFEAKQAAETGATDIDMVINVGAIKSGEWDIVENDIRTVVESVPGCIVKVIIETCLLTDEEKLRAVECIVNAKAHYVKTSTGFNTGGATVEDIALLRKAAGDRLKVKASGGIRTKEQAEALVNAGADTLGVGNAMLFV